MGAKASILSVFGIVFPGIHHWGQITWLRLQSLPVIEDLNIFCNVCIASFLLLITTVDDLEPLQLHQGRRARVDTVALDSSAARLYCMPGKTAWLGKDGQSVSEERDSHLNSRYNPWSSSVSGYPAPLRRERLLPTGSRGVH